MTSEERLQLETIVDSLDREALIDMLHNMGTRLREAEWELREVRRQQEGQGHYWLGGK